MSAQQLTIESTDQARLYFEEYINANEESAFIEETSSMDGEKIICLIIEKLPAILTGVTALITALKAKGISVKIKENGVEQPADKVITS